MEADVRRPEARRPMVESRIRNPYTVRTGNAPGSQSTCTTAVHHNIIAQRPGGGTQLQQERSNDQLNQSDDDVRVSSSSPAPHPVPRHTASSGSAVSTIIGFPIRSAPKSSHSARYLPVVG